MVSANEQLIAHDMKLVADLIGTSVNAIEEATRILGAILDEGIDGKLTLEIMTMGSALNDVLFTSPSLREQSVAASKIGDRLKKEISEKMKRELKEPSFEETRDEIIKKLQSVYKTVDAIQWSLNDWAEKLENIESAEVNSLSLAVEDIVDDIQDTISRLEAL